MSSSSTNTAKFATQTYVFDPRPAYPLQLAVKRYLAAGSITPSLPTATATHFAGSGTKGGTIPAPALVFAHGCGFNKELWEPVIDDVAVLIEGQEGPGKEASGTRVAVGDIWAVDCPNHGDSTALNREVLRIGYEPIFGWEEYARSVHLFINGHGRLRRTGGVEQPVVYPFAPRSVIGVGHSMGGVAFGLSLTYASSSTNPFSYTPDPAVHPIRALVLVEPMIMLPTAARTLAAGFTTGVQKRRDTWASRAEAREKLGRTLVRQGWDARSVASFVEHGIGSVDGNDQGDGPVTLKCTKAQEAACYRDPLGHTRLYLGFGALVKSLPVHLMYGAVDDYLPAEVKTDVVENQAGGVGNLASYARVPGGGHLVPFQAPTALAEKIFDALRVQVGVDAGIGVGAGLGGLGPGGGVGGDMGLERARL